jgi:hypothetical protein
VGRRPRAPRRCSGRPKRRATLLNTGAGCVPCLSRRVTEGGSAPRPSGESRTRRSRRVSGRPQSRRVATRILPLWRAVLQGGRSAFLCPCVGEHRASLCRERTRGLRRLIRRRSDQRVRQRELDAAAPRTAIAAGGAATRERERERERTEESTGPPQAAPCSASVFTSNALHGGCKEAGEWPPAGIEPAHAV